MGLDVAAVDLAGLCNPAFLRQRRQDARPDAPAAPTVPTIPTIPTIIDRRRRAVFGRAIRPAAAALEHVHDTGSQPAIIDPALRADSSASGARSQPTLHPTARTTNATSPAASCFSGDSLNQCTRRYSRGLFSLISMIIFALYCLI